MCIWLYLVHAPFFLLWVESCVDGKPSWSKSPSDWPEKITSLVGCFTLQERSRKAMVYDGLSDWAWIQISVIHSILSHAMKSHFLYRLVTSRIWLAARTRHVWWKRLLPPWWLWAQWPKPLGLQTLLRRPAALQDVDHQIVFFPRGFSRRVTWCLCNRSVETPIKSHWICFFFVFFSPARLSRF